MILIPISIVLMCGAGLAFLWAVESGQFEDLDLHALDLQDDTPPENPDNESVDAASDLVNEEQNG